MSGKVVLCIVVSAGLSALRCGAAVYQSDGSPASVQGLHNAVLNGDTITIPAGTFTWNTQIRITKNITLAGAGAGMTIINDNVPKSSGGDSTVLMLFTGINGNLRVTGFTVRGQAQDTSNFNKGTIAVKGSSHSVRIDHITFDQPGSSGIRFDGAIWGVVDHCYFNEPNGKEGVYIGHGGWGGAPGFGDGSWEQATNLGSGEGIYIEDNTFVGNALGGTPATDASQGGRFVFRYNTLIKQNVGNHGTEGARNRGVRSYEFYRNTFISETAIMDKAVQLRGGTGVIWGNTARGAGGNSPTGYKNFLFTHDYRTYRNYTNNFGSCTGSNPWDGNTDGTGYPCIDQVGRGIALDQVRGSLPINQRTGNAASPRNQSEPVYVWDNNWTPVPNNPGLYIANGESVVQTGRDIIDNVNTPMPGYRPFTYPHPLTASFPAPPTPTPAPTPSATACSRLQERLDRLQRRQQRLQTRHRQNRKLNRRIRRVQQQLQLQHCA